MSLLPKSSRRRANGMKLATGAKIATMAAALVLATACGDDGPNYPDVFDPAAMQDELSTANAAMMAPATESFAASGPLIDNALVALDGEPLALEAPAMLLDGGHLRMSEARSVATRLRRAASLRTAVAGGTRAHAIPPAALGKTFEYNPVTDEYEMGNEAGAPSNGVRFVLYAVDPIDGSPVEPLVERGYVDLTRTATSSSATARVVVYTAAASPVLDYAARIAGAVTSPRVELEGFARNGEDRLDFTLETAFSLQDESIEIDWRTRVPTRDLITRLQQSFNDGADATFQIDAAVVSASGRIDMDGTIHEETGGSIAVKVNGETFATMVLANGEADPTVVNAGGEPLTQEEQATLLQIFEWFAGAIFVFILLLAPMGTLLDSAF
jgi:hypothetical protein